MVGRIAVVSLSCNSTGWGDVVLRSTEFVDCSPNPFPPWQVDSAHSKRIERVFQPNEGVGFWK
jgi:hypothetical protein